MTDTQVGALVLVGIAVVFGVLPSGMLFYWLGLRKGRKSATASSRTEAPGATTKVVAQPQPAKVGATSALGAVLVLEQILQEIRVLNGHLGARRPLAATDASASSRDGRPIVASLSTSGK